MQGVGPVIKSWVARRRVVSSHFEMLVLGRCGGAEDPRVGDQLHFKIMINNQIVDEQADTLKEPLQSGYAFGIQAYFDDYSKGNTAGEE